MSDTVESLAQEFRRHLEGFYACLKLAPPYDSVEKAIRALMDVVRTLPDAERQRVLADPSAQWSLFRQAFDQAGLTRKHRGIIASLARNRAAVDLPADYDQFLNLFL
jgi:hypothetical protein